MKSELDTKKLAKSLKNKRGSVGLRVTAAEIGASPATLSRVEQGNLPDIETYIKICRWMEVPTDTFITGGQPNHPPINALVAHLRADRTLSSDTAEMLIKMINFTYRSNVK